MMCRLLRFRCLSAAALVGSVLLAGKAQGGEPSHGRPIEFSDPKGKDATTNLNQFNPRRGALRDLEEDLYKPLQGFAPRNSLDGLDASLPQPPAAPMIQSRKVKELLERRRNWWSQNPDDDLNGPSMEDIFKLPQYGPDGKEKKSPSAIESYYERLNLEHRHDSSETSDTDLLNAYAKSGAKDDPRAKDKDKDKDKENGLSGELSEREKAVRRLLDSNSSDAPAAPESASFKMTDFFGLNQNTTPRTREQIEAHKLVMEQFKILSSSPVSSAAPAEPLTSLAPVTDWRSANLPGIDPAPVPSQLPATASKSSSGFESGQSGFIAPIAPTGLPDLGSKTPLGATPWNQPPPSTKIDPIKITPPVGTVDFQRRKF